MVIVRKAVETAVKLSKYDKLAWDKLYFGIRKDIKLGIKHGFGAGSILGDFIFNQDNPLDNATIFPGNGHAASSKDKTRSRFRGGRRRDPNHYCRPNRRNRYSYSRSNKFRTNR